jgi:hypothetical protein
VTATLMFNLLVPRVRVFGSLYTSTLSLTGVRRDLTSINITEADKGWASVGGAEILS